MKWFQHVCVIGLLVQSVAVTAWDAYDTPDDFLAWMKANQSVEPQFIDGDVITYDKAELLRPFVPPAYQEELFYDGMAVDIKDAGDLTAADSFKAATAKFAGQAGLDSDLGIVNYTSGLPFDRTKFTPGSREDGFKLAWNFNYRWNYEGAEVGENERISEYPGN